MELMRGTRRAITLVELITVFGIITVLLALATGAASKVSREARSGTCRSNLRQLAIATESYRNVNDGGLPAAVLYFDEPGGGVRTEAWDFVQASDGTSSPGAIWSFMDRVPEVNQCPEFKGPSTFGSDPLTGYNYNTSFLGAEGTLPWTAPDGRRRQGWSAARLGLRSGSHHKPDRCALFADAGWKGGANKFMRAPGNTVEYDLGRVYAGGQAFRHGGCCNVVHLDGHCSGACDPFEGVNAQPWLLEDIMAFPANGFLSDDDSLYDPR
jgi:type II secretory pathway pseudopilin PulG